MKKLLFYLGSFISRMCSPVLARIHFLHIYFYGGYVSSSCNIIDKSSFSVDMPVSIVGDNITIHSGYIRRFTRISSICKYRGTRFSPKICIGKNANIGINNHIGAINEVVIGDNFLSGANCLIIDHNHGSSNHDDIFLPPNDRKLESPGKINIGNNVHVGDNVIILPNVIIGDNVIIGAGSVVTKSICSSCIAVGNPARVIKKID